MSGGVQQITVSQDDGEVRLDRWFKRHFPEVSFGQVQKWLRKGSVRVDGKRAKGEQRVSPGQVIRIPPLGEASEKKAAPKTKPKSLPLDEYQIKDVRSWVLHQDARVIALNKPPGLATQGGSGQKKHLDGLLDALAYDGQRPRLVHRLDKDTSGVILLGRTAGAAAELGKAFRGRTARKAYWALVLGRPEMDQGIINAPLAKLPGKGGEKMLVDEHQGQSAVTHYQVIESVHRTCSWVLLEPKTGRTHQLRAHMAAIGHPIVGDGKYGGKEAFLEGHISKKLHLHARRLQVPDPSLGVLTVAAPLPAHMVQSFKFFGLQENMAPDFIDED